MFFEQQTGIHYNPFDDYRTDFMPQLSATLKYQWFDPLKDKAEIDFIIHNKGKAVPVEVNFSEPQKIAI